MAKKSIKIEKVSPKRPGRPPTGRQPMLAVRLSPSLKAAIETWKQRQGDTPSRSEAIRRLLNLALGGGSITPEVTNVIKSAIRHELDQERRRLTGFQIRAARAVLGWSAEDLARASAVSLRTIRRAELSDVHKNMTVANEQAVRRALEAAGVEFIEENGGGPGVRLRKRQPRRRSGSEDS
jgi:Arc/MetJ-type ribon-helix-helix transcriptional regulator